MHSFLKIFSCEKKSDFKLEYYDNKKIEWDSSERIS